MKKKSWYKLDNVGKFYSFTNKHKIPAVFRYSVALKEMIEPNFLKQAVEEALNYFPNFNCHLKKGFFWYYLETSDNNVPVTKEHGTICSKIYRDENDVLFRITYYQKRINFEVSHILADGRGSLSFFKCIVYKYLILKHGLENISIDSDASMYEKVEDSFDKYYTKQKIKLPKKRKIYQYKGKKKQETTYMEYHISAQNVLALAHQYDASLTSLLIAVLLCAYHNQMKELEQNQVLKIDVPVDLRQFFKSSTARNFFGITSVMYQFSPDWKFEDVIQSVHQQLKKNVTTEQLKIRMNQMISLEKNFFIRIVPIFLKEFILKIADYVTSSSCTSCLSNIGVIKVDERLEKYIENFNVLTTTGSLRVTVCSFQDDLSIGISSKYISNDIVKDFCRFFSNQGIYGVMNLNEEDVDAEM